MRLQLLLATFVISVLLPQRNVAAHEFRPATLLLRELGDGEVYFQWRPPGHTRGRRAYPSFPTSCRVQGPTRLRCPAGGLRGSLSIEGLERTGIEVVVQVQRRDGTRETTVLNESTPAMTLGERPTGSSGIGLAYLEIGVEHILAGIDHLFFVAGLLLLIGFTRKLLWTITSFTVAHSLTLALSVLDLVRIPQPPVEATIALSIVFLASECLSNRPTLIRRAPWLVAFVFGLLHGLGFAGALLETGLPKGSTTLALVCFNLGIELGQLGLIALAYVVWRLLRDRVPSMSLRQITVYAMGSLAAFWTIERVLAIPGWI